MSSLTEIRFRQYRRFVVKDSYRYQVDGLLTRPSALPAYIHSIFGAIDYQAYKELGE